MRGHENPLSIHGILSALLITVRAVPRVAFPFNSQVPIVARVDQTYDFQISASTFEPAWENFTYSLSNQPRWLSVDSVTRTLTGRPSSSDVGSSMFTLTAADNTGTVDMICTLIVSAEPAPKLEGNLGAQLALSANLSSAQPPVLTILPTSSFHLDFSHTSFIDIVPRKLYYYATLNDHTPLPAWLDFNSNTLVFSGTAPELSAFPQSWVIDLIASDVQGFSGTSAPFTITIATQELVFVPQQQTLHLKAGEHLDYTQLRSSLFRDGQILDPTDLASARADVPSWLRFDSESLSIEGIAPTEFENVNVTVVAMDSMGDNATAVITILNANSSFFAASVGPIVVYAGQRLNYHFSDSSFTRPGLDLKVDLPASASWIHFDRSSRVLEGTAPTHTYSSEVKATLIAQASDGLPQSQVFTIYVGAKSSGVIPTSTELTTRVPPTASSTTAPNMSTGSERVDRRLAGGVVAAIVVLSLIAATLFAICLILCFRQRRRREHHRQPPSCSKDEISRPILPDDNSNARATGNERADVERDSDQSITALPQTRAGLPPKIDIDFASQPREQISKWRNRISRISKVSSLGYGGEDAINVNSNIPELGRELELLQQSHPSFLVPDSMAKLSRTFPEMSPVRQASPASEEENRVLPIARLDNGIGLRKSYPSRKSLRRRRRRRSYGLPAAMTTSSLASLSTGISVFSTRPSDFPKPPATLSNSSLASLQSHAGRNSEKRRTIRLVDASEILTDDRPIDVKRQSFIRARASSGQQNPLFAHGSRALSGSSKKVASCTGSARTASRRYLAKTYSESSSVEPGQPRYMRHISCQAPVSFPHVVSGLSVKQEEMDHRGGAQEGRDSSSGYSTTSSSISNENLIKQMLLPKHQRSWVLPGEASPTPPPLSIARRLGPKTSEHSLQ